MALHPYPREDTFPSRLHRQGALRLLQRTASHLPPDAYSDHSALTNRLKLEELQEAREHHWLRTKQGDATTISPANAYARYIASKAALVAEDAQRMLAKIRRQSQQRRKSL